LSTSKEIKLRLGCHYLFMQGLASTKPAGAAMNCDVSAISRVEIDAFYSMMEKWPRSDRDEIASESLMRLAKKIHYGLLIENPVAWLLSAAKFIRRERWRELRRTFTVREEEPDRRWNGKRLPVARQREHSAAKKTERVRIAVAHALDQLPEGQRRVVELCDMQGRSESEAARELGVCRSTAKSWHKRADASLRDNHELRRLLKTNKA
jgi:RNA polymerase sigma factor (sigma-70 family)